MNRHTQPFETHQHDLTGYASLDFHDRDDFNSFAARIAGYNPDRFEPLAIKIFAQETDLIVTLFALDKSKQDQADYPKDKLPVRKFKLPMDWKEFLKHVKFFDLVVSNGNHDLEDMMVFNK